jgi:hypothetical protein
LGADAYRLAFADPEFLLRRETRGIRFQLEMLKPDIDPVLFFFSCVFVSFWINFPLLLLLFVSCVYYFLYFL